MGIWENVLPKGKSSWTIIFKDGTSKVYKFPKDWSAVKVFHRVENLWGKENIFGVYSDVK